MKKLVNQAKDLIVEFKGDDYVFGSGVLDQAGSITAKIGKRALLVSRLSSAWLNPALNRVIKSLQQNEIEIVSLVQGASPNAPFEDVYRLQTQVLNNKPDLIISLESGSGIDACKAAAVLATFNDVEPELDAYFGVGKITNLC